MEEDESFDKFYAKLKDIVNSAFNLGETIPEPKIVRKVLRSLLEGFHAKITTIEESKDIDQIPLTELVGNLQTYELGLTRIGKMGKAKSMALKAKSSETDESLDDENSKMKSYITRQFKKFMKNANGKGFNKDCRQSSSSQFKGQDKGKKDAKEGGQYTVPTVPKCFGCQGFGHMKHECPTYLKSIGKSKAFAATLSDTEPEDDSNNEDDGILNAFTASVDPTKGIVEDMDEKEDLWTQSLIKWMIKMISTRPMRNYTSFPRSRRNCIGWPPRSSVMWNLTVRNFPQSLMRQIKPLKY